MKLSDIFNYIQGNIRYQLFYSRFDFLIRKHIKEQIRFRIKVMNRECYNSGSCIKCGCKTTALQMCNKSCDGNCYPPIMDKKDWEMFSLAGKIIDNFQFKKIISYSNSKVKIIGEGLLYNNKTVYSEYYEQI